MQARIKDMMGQEKVIQQTSAIAHNMEKILKLILEANKTEEVYQTLKIHWRWTNARLNN